jgi:hypothetical protein
MAVYHNEEPDKIPWLIYEELFPRGYMDRQLRNKGLGLKVSAPVFREEIPHVRVETRTVGDYTYRTFHTPLGDLTTKERIGLSEGAGASWLIEHPVKDVSDFAAAEYMIEDTVYVPDNELFLKAKRNIGDDGIIFVWAGRSPLQKMQIELMGYKTFAVAMYQFRNEFQSLYRVLEKKANERYKLISESLAEIINGGDNINSEIVSPRLFDQYITPFYERQARLLHKKDKILEDHMDGKLRHLKDAIAKMDLNAIEAFTPPPMGDLPLVEARSAWKGKIISLNFPESVFLEGATAVKKQTLKVLNEATPGDNFIITVTEDIPSDHRWTGLSTVTTTLRKYGAYPLTWNNGLNEMHKIFTAS